MAIAVSSRYRAHWTVLELAIAVCVALCKKHFESDGRVKIVCIFQMQQRLHFSIKAAKTCV